MPNDLCIHSLSLLLSHWLASVWRSDGNPGCTSIDSLPTVWLGSAPSLLLVRNHGSLPGALLLPPPFQTEKKGYKEVKNLASYSHHVPVRTGLVSWSLQAESQVSYFLQ